MNKSKYKWVRNLAGDNIQSGKQQHTNPLMQISQFKSISSAYQSCSSRSVFHLDNVKKNNKTPTKTNSFHTYSSASHQHCYTSLKKTESNKPYVSNYKLVKSDTHQLTKSFARNEFIENKGNFKLDFRLRKSPNNQYKKSVALPFLRKSPCIRSKYKIDLRTKPVFKSPKHKILYTKHKKRILSLNMMKTPNLHKYVSPPISKQILNYHYRSSVHKAKQNLVIRKKLPCIFYNRTGTCKAGNTCKFRHDPALIRLCTKFLKGSCSLGENCPLSHSLDDNKLPICSFFIRGQCVKPNCAFLHVKHSSDAPECLLFQRGLCTKGKLCTKRHVWTKGKNNVVKEPVNLNSRLLKKKDESINQNTISSSESVSKECHQQFEMSWRFCEGPAFIPLPEPNLMDCIDSTDF